MGDILKSRIKIIKFLFSLLLICCIFMEGCSLVLLIYKRLSVENFQIKNYLATKKRK